MPPHHAHEGTPARGKRQRPAAVSRIANIEEKTGRSGRFVLMTRETTYTNQHGEVVVRARLSTIAN